ncbi:MAG: hypothetical protein H6765_06835 [Candidatus Peribacteria bacterium]|nr:MAG: hypothetical protein H6765_06835 [Candidatus Peribacteria bacterium]
MLYCLIYPFACMYLEKHCIVRNCTDPSRQTTLSFPETSVTLPELEVLVWWKQAFHRRSVREVGDGMQLLLIYERPYILNDLAVEVFVNALSLYQEYDEEQNSYATFLYKFPKGGETLQVLQDVLDAYSDEVSVSQGRFTQLLGVPVLSKSEVEKVLHKQKIAGALSLLFGLLMGYGNLRGEGSILHNAHIKLPLMGSIVLYRDLIIASFQLLREHGMFLQYQEIQAKEVSYLEIYISDWEILQHMATWIAPGSTYTSVSKFLQ